MIEYFTARADPLMTRKANAPFIYTSQVHYGEIILLEVIKAEKRRLIRELKRLIAPHLWESGYLTGTAGARIPLRLWVPRSASGTPLEKELPVRGITLSCIMGFVADGIITDGFGHGLVTQSFSSLPIEDLAALRERAPGFLSASHRVARKTRDTPRPNASTR